MEWNLVSCPAVQYEITRQTEDRWEGAVRSGGLYWGPPVTVMAYDMSARSQACSNALSKDWLLGRCWFQHPIGRGLAHCEAWKRPVVITACL